MDDEGSSTVVSRPFEVRAAKDTAAVVAVALDTKDRRLSKPGEGEVVVELLSSSFSCALLDMRGLLGKGEGDRSAPPLGTKAAVLPTAMASNHKAATTTSSVACILSFELRFQLSIDLWQDVFQLRPTLPQQQQQQQQQRSLVTE